MRQVEIVLFVVVEQMEMHHRVKNALVVILIKIFDAYFADVKFTTLFLNLALGLGVEGFLRYMLRSIQLLFDLNLVLIFDCVARSSTLVGSFNHLLNIHLYKYFLNILEGRMCRLLTVG